MISKATDNKQGALVAELVPIKNALDEALAKSSSNYANARDAYKLAQTRIDALDLGKTLAPSRFGQKMQFGNFRRCLTQKRRLPSAVATPIRR